MARTPIHPGEHLAEALEVLAMTASGLARELDVPTNRITSILNGTRAVTADTALRLARFFGTSAQFWMNLQQLYDLRQAESEIGPALKRIRRAKPVDGATFAASS
jgi:addiction module HigA family antidote